MPRVFVGSGEEATKGVFAGERIQTDLNRALLELKGGPRVILRHNTAVRAGRGENLLHLEDGKVVVRSQTGCVDFADGRVCARDATFTLESTVHGIAAGVYAGSLDVTSGSRTWTLDAGSMAAWGKEGAEPDIRPLEAALPEDMQRLLEEGR
jgi:hypothetical protein